MTNRLPDWFRATPSVAPERRPLPQFRVILHRPDQIAMPALFEAIRRLFHFAEAEANARMWTTFRQGQAVMLTTHLERAELYVEQLQHRGLRATWESV